MAKLTIGFGVVLILLGAWGFIGTGSTHPTALIPAYFGLVLAMVWEHWRSRRTRSGECCGCMLR